MRVMRSIWTNLTSTWPPSAPFCLGHPCRSPLGPLLDLQTPWKAPRGHETLLDDLHSNGSEPFTGTLSRMMLAKYDQYSIWRPFKKGADPYQRVTTESLIDQCPCAQSAQR